MGQREEWARGRSGPEGGVGQREVWARGRSGPEGGVDQREVWARGRCGPEGGAGQRAEWAISICSQAIKDVPQYCGHMTSLGNGIPPILYEIIPNNVIWEQGLIRSAYPTMWPSPPNILKVFLFNVVSTNLM